MHDDGSSPPRVRSELVHKAVGRNKGAEGFWVMLAVRLLHPMQLQIIEAMRWIGRPLSASQLVKVLDGEATLSTVAYHVRRLAELGALKPGGRRQVRGAMEKSYRLAAKSGSKAPGKRQPQR